MWALAILIILAVPLAIGLYVFSAPRHPVAPDDPGNADVTDTSTHPDVGGRSPTKGGRPIPGSEAARRRQGKP